MVGLISSTPKDLKGRAESAAAFLSYNVCEKCGSLTHQCEGAAFILGKVFGNSNLESNWTRDERWHFGRKMAHICPREFLPSSGSSAEEGQTLMWCLSFCLPGTPPPGF